MIPTPLVKFITDKLSAFPSLANAEQRIALAHEIAAETDRKLAEAHSEIARLKGELAKRVPPEFVEHRGVLWKRLPTGGFAPDAYCPEHRAALSRFAGELICTVNKCGRQAPFDNRQLPQVHASIPHDA